MGKVRGRKDRGFLFFDFQYQGLRCREYTTLPDTAANRKRMRVILKRIESEIELGTFDYATAFPNSPNAKRFGKTGSTSGLPTFKEFADTWIAEMSPQWRPSYIETTRLTLDNHLVPEFGGKVVDEIGKAEILAFRAKLVALPGRQGKRLSASRVNHIMNPLGMILTEAADRFDFKLAFRGIKALPVPKSDVDPFTLDEVRTILEKVRPDFRNYFMVRFFTGLRTSEVDGLLWRYVDFERRQILVRETIVRGEPGEAKTAGSVREVQMSEPVFEALQAQQKVTGQGRYVFCNTKGEPLDHNNVCKRVWYPLLRFLGITQRRPYQTRHTAATLWLAAGEAPEWIARKLGHTSTEMLFRVYSRFVPNLTRRDGSAMGRLLRQHGFGDAADPNVTALPPQSGPALPAPQTPEVASPPRSLSPRKPEAPADRAERGPVEILDVWF